MSEAIGYLRVSSAGRETGAALSCHVQSSYARIAMITGAWRNLLVLTTGSIDWSGGTPRGLGRATATTSAVFLPHCEHRVRCAQGPRASLTSRPGALEPRVDLAHRRSIHRWCTRRSGATIGRAAGAGVRNVLVETRDLVSDGCGRPDASVRFVMLFNILHIDDPLSLLREVHRVLRIGGVAGVIHWRPDIETPRGPSLDIRPEPAQCRAWAEKAGLHWLSSPALRNCP
jgi:hypothetical protein